jgi:hypothetical protein
MIIRALDRLCGLVVRVPGYRCRSLGFDFRHYQVGPLVTTAWRVLELRMEGTASSVGD